MDLLFFLTQTEEGIISNSPWLPILEPNKEASAIQKWHAIQKIKLPGYGNKPFIRYDLLSLRGIKEGYKICNITGWCTFGQQVERS